MRIERFVFWRLRIQCHRSFIRKINIIKIIIFSPIQLRHLLPLDYDALFSVSRFSLLTRGSGALTPAVPGVLWGWMSLQCPPLLIGSACLTRTSLLLSPCSVNPLFNLVELWVPEVVRFSIWSTMDFSL